MNSDMFLVSVIITTKNEEKNIENCLISIKEQTYQNIEIVVVDNNSDDRTKEISLKYTDKVYNMGPERSAQRNYAVEKSSGEYFLQLDADQMLNKNVVSECVEKVIKFKNTQKIHQNAEFKDIAIQIPEKIIGDSFLNKIRNYEREFYARTPIDCARFMPKHIFCLVGGYDLSLTGPEDWDLDSKISKYCCIDYTNTPFLHNESDITLKKLLEKKKYYSDGVDKFAIKYKDDVNTLKRIGIPYRYFFVFIENKKWKKIFRHPILFSCMYFIRILIGISYLTNRTKV